MTEKTKTVLPAEVEALAAKIRASLTVTTNNSVGNASAKDKDSNVYMETLPEGLTPEIIKAVDAHDVQYVAACHAVVGEIGLELLGENPDLKKTTTHAPFHTAGSVTSTWTPSRTGRSPGGEAGTTLTHYGEIRSVVKHVDNHSSVITDVGDWIADLTQKAIEAKKKE